MQSGYYDKNEDLAEITYDNNSKSFTLITRNNYKFITNG